MTQGHVIQECIEFRDIVQDLMDMKEIEFSKLNDSSIDVITSTTYLGILTLIGPRPITIFMTMRQLEMKCLRSRHRY